MDNTCRTLNNNLEPELKSQSTVFIGRQPIFDREMNIFAYEMLYRNSKVNGANITDENAATSTVITNLITEFGFNTATHNKIAFINLSEEFLTGERPIVLPKKNVVLEILEDTIVNDKLIENLYRLINQGFVLALDDFIYSSEWDRVLPLVEYIKVEIPLLNREEIKNHVTKLKKYNVKLLAEKIESEEEYEFLLACGFDLFQGYFLAKPKVMERKTLSANKINILSLISDLNNDFIEIKDLVKSISKDISLCYKILQYINSAHCGLPRKIDSISEAITYVGLKKLKNWAMLITMSNVSSRPDALMQLTMTRAYMCKQIAEQLKEDNTERYFSVGLLSTLDVLLGSPMEQILKKLPLSDEIQDALMHYEGSAGKILECAVMYERCEWDNLNRLDINVASRALRDCFFNAVKETNNNI